MRLLGWFMVCRICHLFLISHCREMLKLLDDRYDIVVFHMVRNNIFMNNTRLYPLQQQLKLLRNIFAGYYFEYFIPK